MNTPRVAFFADSFHEINGVANTCRTLARLAAHHQSPFLLIHGANGPESEEQGSFRRLAYPRGHWRFAVDRDFHYDPLFYRHRRAAEEVVRDFAPDVIHITGPGDAGTLGLVLAKVLHLPLCASWHTNLHEYAGRRLEKVARLLPARAGAWLGTAAESGSLSALGRFYRAADSVMAPNEELLGLLGRIAGRPGFLMRRGVDTALFTPARRPPGEAPFTVGYVGRLTVEKNIHFLPRLATAFAEAGIPDVRFRIVGEGIERERLERELPNAEFTGVLRGEELARAYAGMDLFAFPSRTDTFGNVVLEALASGVPAVVTADGGPKYIVRSGETGFIAETDAAFLRCAVELARDRILARRMGLAARRQGLETSWDAVWGEMQTAWRYTVSAAASKLATRPKEVLYHGR